MRKQLAVSIPALRTPADCTPWVLGGLWPAELEHVTPQTAGLAEHLKSDLQRIANSANHKLRAINAAGLTESVRQAEETWVINNARAFAVLRVESTIRHLRKEPLGFQPESLSLGAVLDGPAVAVTSPVRVPAQKPPPEPAKQLVETNEVYETCGVEGPSDAHVADESVAVRSSSFHDTARPELRVTRPEFTPSNESVELRLRRLVEYVARQEPGLRWAAGERADGTTLLVCDLAHGWIPPGINLPAGVELLPPGRRFSGVAALLGPTERNTTYRPGDSFTAARDFVATLPSKAVREAPPVDDLGWQLTEATHWRDGLPRMAHTLAKAGAAGTGVVEAELDVLRVHLDTARYQVLAQYPDIDDVLLCNYLLLAATDAIATGDSVAANYHFAWFHELSAPAAGGWGMRG